jgi:lipopolysaccharide export system protein LptA
MVLKVGGETLKLEITGKQIQVSGSFLKATGDRLTHNRADGSLLLEGKVKLSYSKNGQKAEITAQRIAVGVGDGSLVVPPTEDLGQQLFSFWTGLFR